MEEFKEHLPLVQTLFNPGMRDRHWEQISDIVGFPMQPDQDMCLSKLVDMNLESYIPRFEQISEAASKEFSLEKAMEKMKAEWDPVSGRWSTEMFYKLFRWLSARLQWLQCVSNGVTAVLH